jgi:hypothetical protein
LREVVLRGDAAVRGLVDFFAVVFRAVLFLAVPVFAFVDFAAAFRAVGFLAAPDFALVDFVAGFRFVVFLAAPVFALVDFFAVVDLAAPVFFDALLEVFVVAISLAPVDTVLGTR